MELKKKRSSGIQLFMAAIAIMLAVVGQALPVWAGTVTWNAAVSGNWSDGTKWSGGVAPAAGDDVVINLDGTYTVTLDTSATVNSLIVGGMSGTQTFFIPSATTLILSSASAFTGGGSLSMNAGATLNNAATLNISSFNVNLTPNGVATLGGAGAVNLTGVGSVSMLSSTGSYTPGTLMLDNGKVLTNSGSFTQLGASWSNWWTGEYGTSPAIVSLANGASSVNAGTWTMKGGIVSSGAGVNSGFTNSGTLTTSTTTHSRLPVGQISVDFTNSGIVNGTVGIFTLAGAGNCTHTGTFTAAAGATLDISAGTHNLTGATPVSGNGNIKFTGSTTIVNPAVMTGGTLSLAGASNTIGDVTAGTLGFAGASNNILNGQVKVGTLTNGGTAMTTLGNATAATVIGALNVSGGTLNITNTTQTYGINTITQSGGTLNLNSAETSTLASVSLTGGTLNNIGVLNIVSLTANPTYGGVATLGGTGAVNLTGVSSANSGYYYNGGSYAASGTLTIDGGKVLTNTAAGNFTASGWRIFGPVTISLANGSRIVNEGTWKLGSANINWGAGTAAVTGFTNTGTLIVGKTTLNWYGNYGMGGTVNVSLVNAGTVNVTAGTLTLAGAGTYTHSGVFNIATGTTINFSAGNHTLSGATALTGAGAITFSSAGTNNIIGSVVMGSLSNSGTTTLSGVTTLSSITQSGAGALNLTDATATGVTSVNVSGGTLSIASPLSALSSVTMSGGSFDINVPVSALSSVTMSGGSFGINVPVSALRTVNMSGGTLTLGETAVTNLTTLTLTGGTLSNAGELNIGSLTANPPYAGNVTLSGAGAVNLTGVGSANAGMYASCGYMSGCSYSASGTLTIDGGKILTNTATGNFIASGWNTAGPVTVALANSSSIVNAGTWTMGSANLNLGAGAAAATGFTNIGTLTGGNSTGDWYGTYGKGGTVNVSLVNTGTINSNFGTLNLTGALTQSGTINVASGATLTKTAGFTNTGTLSGTGTIAVGTGGSKLVNQGTINLGGVGTTGTLTITGDLQLGNGSNLNMELGGTVAGQYDKLAVSGAVLFDGMINVNLINTYTAGYTPAINDSFKIITFNSKSGNFSTNNVLIAGERWNVTYTVGDATLGYYDQVIGAISFSPAALSVGGMTTVSATSNSGLAVNFSTTTPNVCTVNGSTITGVTEGICTIAADQAGNANYHAAKRVTRDISTSSIRRTVTWSSAVSGNWSDGSKWSGGAAPTAGDNAVITMDGTYTVTLDTNATANSLTIGGTSGTQTLSNGGNTLNLNTTGSVNANSVIDLSDGMLNMSGATTLGGTMKNGTITSDGTLTSSNGTLNGVTLGGTNMTVGGTLHVANGITLAEGLTVNSGNTTWYFSGTKNINTPGNAAITSSGGFFYPSEDEDNATLTIGSGITLQGICFKEKPSYTYCPVCTGCWYCYNYSFKSTIDNSGTIISDTAGQCLNDPSVGLTNNGDGSLSSLNPAQIEDPNNNPKANSKAEGTDAPAQGQCSLPPKASKDPVDLATGYFYDTLRLMEVAAAGAPLHMDLNYSSGSPSNGNTGFGWGHSYQYRLTALTTAVQVTWPDRHISYYALNGAGRYINSGADPSDILVKNPDGTYTLTDRRQKTYNFDATGKLVSTVDRLGFTRNFAYLANGNLDKVTDALSGRFLQFVYDEQNRVTSVTGTGAGSVVLAYNANGNLASVTDALGNVNSLTYDASHRLLSKVNALGDTVVTNTYDAVTGRVSSQDDGLAMTPLEQFTYGTDATTGKPYTDYLNRAGSTTRMNFDARLNSVSTVDPLGGTEIHGYATSGARTAYKDPLNNQTQFSYDSSGYILSRTDAQGHVASYTYDAEHNIITSTDEAGNITTMTYGPNHQLLSKTDAAGNVTTYTYNAQGLLATLTEPKGGMTSYIYDAQGNLTSKVDPAGLTTGYTYDTAGRMLTRTDGAGNDWTWTYDLMGQVLTVATPSGNTTHYSYDALGRVATKTAPGGGITIYAYDIHDNLTSLTDALGNVTTFAYDADDHLIRTTDALGHVTTVIRDAKGRVSSVTDPLGNITSRSYNAADDVTAKKDALNNQSSFAYDELRRLTAVTDPLNKSTALAYDAVSRVTSHTDAKGNATSFSYDALGQMVSATNALGGSASQAFDQNGNRVSFTDTNGNITTFTLDTANRITSISTADGGAINYTYNNKNLIATATNGRGQVATYTHNAAGQLVTLADQAGTTTFTYDANGNVLTVGDAVGTSSYTYDLLSRISGYTDVFGNHISYGYDAVGNLTTLTYPGNKAVTYAYDAANRMTSVTDWSGHATAYTYDARGNMTLITRANGTKGAYSYDAKGQVTSIVETTMGNASLYGIALTYDANGNITSEITTPSPMPLAITAASMTYGPDNRLATANGQAVTYDADGNMTSGPMNGASSAYSFDARSRLTGVGSSSYVYDAQGNRVSATNAGVTTRYVVDPNAALPRVLMEADAAGTPIAYYVYGIGLISKESATGTYQTYHYDLRGSTLKLTDSTGSVTDSYRYGPYGELVSTTGETANPFRFNGRDGVMTEANGLYYMRARYYLPEARRFVSRDMLLGSLDQTLTLNRFAYVNGNPVGFVDPSGMNRAQTNAAIMEIAGGAIMVAEGLVAAPFTAGTSLVIVGSAGYAIGDGLARLQKSEGWTPLSTVLKEFAASTVNGVGDLLFGSQAAASDVIPLQSTNNKRKSLTVPYPEGEAPEVGFISKMKGKRRQKVNENKSPKDICPGSLSGSSGIRG